MKKNGTFIGVAILLIAIITGCAKMPQEENDAAVALMDSLKAKKADIYLPDEFAAFEESYDAAMDLVTDKSYKKAKESLVQVVEQGTELEEATDAKKAEILEELTEIYDEAKEVNNDNKNNIPKRGGASRVMAFQKDVNAIANDLDEIAEIMEEDGNLLEALEKAEEVLEDAKDVSSRLATAVATSAPAKKPRTTKTKTGSMMSSKKK